LITGTSSGIGQALARVFAAHGHRLALTARREAELAALADEIAAGGQPRPLIIVADLAHPDGPARIAAGLAAAGIEPAILVNNAGFALYGDAASLDRAEQSAMIDLNTRALTDLTLRCIDGIRRQRGGILNVASIAGFMPAPGMAVYHATKAYVVAFSEALHEELKGDGVRVCALCPGPVPTGFNARAGVPEGFLPDYLALSASHVARAGYDGFMGGHRVVVPGKLNRIATLLPRLLPRGLINFAMTLRWNEAKRHGG
jgi:short-subunit dehydrogenase